MKEYQPEQLKNQFLNIPLEVQEAISSVEVADALSEIGKKHLLHLDQINSLMNVVGEVMLGMTPPQNFRSRLGEELPLTKDILDMMVGEVDEQVFRPIKRSLMQIYEKKEEAPTVQQPHSQEDNMSAHEILHAIENPWRMTYKTEPIEMELPAPQKTGPVTPFQKPPQPQVAPQQPKAPLNIPAFAQRVSTPTNNPIPKAPIPQPLPPKPIAPTPVPIRKDFPLPPKPPAPVVKPPTPPITPKPEMTVEFIQKNTPTPETLAELPPSLQPNRINIPRENPVVLQKPITQVVEQKPRVPAEPPANLPTGEGNPIAIKTKPTVEIKPPVIEKVVEKGPVAPKLKNDPYREPV